MDDHTKIQNKEITILKNVKWQPRRDNTCLKKRSYRRLSPPTSGSARRRELLRRRAEQTRKEGERIARERQELMVRQKLENQRMALEQLSSYEPWGRAGGGAPNLHSIRRTDLRAEGIIPEDELKGISQYEVCRRWEPPQRRGPARRVRLREDPQLCYADALRTSVDNHLRYRSSPDRQHHYKETLDEMVQKRKRAEKEEIKRNQEYERKMQNMAGPWGKPGPGGTIWRNPRNIGLNFHNSMGWTTNDMFQKMQGDHKNLKRSSLTLPKVKRADDAKGEKEDKENKPSNVDKLPDINHSNGPIGSRQNSGEKKSLPDKKSPDSEKVVTVDTTTTKTNSRHRNQSKRSQKKKGTIVKRLPNGERVKRVVIEESISEEAVEEKKPTPETAILRVTGGIELVPLLARKRRVGARTLHSSDVTRPPDQPCQYVSRLPERNMYRWREETSNHNYLQELKHQIEVKYIRKEEGRKNSAESVRQHHMTWSSLWGRPGHGAPQHRGRYARSNLAQLLYVTPLAHTVEQRF